MKILHTSDWHIGRKLFNKELDETHRLFFEWLINTITEEHVEILIVSGDIFDIAFPSNSSLQLYYQTLIKIQQTCCKHIIITGGNHDSPNTLNAPKEILQHLNIHVVGGIKEAITEQIVELKSDNQIQLVVCAVPYLRDKDVRKAIAGESPESRIQALREGIINYYQQLADVCTVYREQLIPVIATGHLFVNDCDMDNDEKELYIGTLQQISFKQFPNAFDYIALGHIHRPQIIGSNTSIRYSGCPIAMDFSDRNQVKSIVLIEFSNSIQPIIKTIDVPVFRNLLLFKGTYQQVEKDILKYNSNGNLKAWGEIQIEESIPDPTIFTRVDKLLNINNEIEILNYRIHFENQIAGADKLFEQPLILTEISEHDIFRLMIEKNNLPKQDELYKTYNELINWMHEETV